MSALFYKQITAEWEALAPGHPLRPALMAISARKTTFTMVGPEASLYKGSSCLLHLTYTDRYPEESPHVHTSSDIWHPNFDVESGNYTPTRLWQANMCTVDLYDEILENLRNPPIGGHALMSDASVFRPTAAYWSSVVRAPRFRLGARSGQPAFAHWDFMVDHVRSLTSLAPRDVIKILSRAQWDLTAALTLAGHH